ncbi:MAG: hypothetical protein F4114_12210 [Rhodospirillaceae bacterium]|nr:hypothetical protein [Rhodospirillaceae bacterium]MYB13544.1 hypothetical protein [Rhodospirillaceae bacterium]MYI49832.1 hypothetical protein [Rhodospirillaceae bacterium]
MAKRYSDKAQPYLDAIANAVFSEQSARDWLVARTHHTPAYNGARSLHREQHALRPKTKQPFYCNYWCGKDARCTCRIAGSKSLETDAMFFLEAGSGRRLAAHVEFKHPGEPLRLGQAEGYPLRAACWADRDRCPGTVLPHDDWLTVIFCGDTEIDDRSVDPFDRRIGHSEARATIPGYPEFIERTG